MVGLHITLSQGWATFEGQGYKRGRTRAIRGHYGARIGLRFCGGGGSTCSRDWGTRVEIRKERRNV